VVIAVAARKIVFTTPVLLTFRLSVLRSLLGRRQCCVKPASTDLGARRSLCGIDGKFRILPE